MEKSFFFCSGVSQRESKNINFKTKKGSEQITPEYVHYVAAGAKNRVTFKLWPQIMISFTIRNNATIKKICST
jgi:hypothetical protein